MNNPFRLTRAADLNDDEISALWVDPQGTLATLLHPESALPMFIFGGRGSGKTHLMRYHSYTIQRKVHGVENMYARVRNSGYIGIHTRCRGLNASRFSSKRLGEVKSQDLFSYHLDLWLGQLLLFTATEFIVDCNLLTGVEHEGMVHDLYELFDVHGEQRDYSLKGFATRLRDLQRALDVAVNNASFRRSVELEIHLTPGKLIFGIPQILAAHVPALNGVMFSLFVDEYEHLYEDQQKHFNTLIRERENPVSFKIGARLHGMRTPRTWGGDEELREGSDYEKLNLDEALRDNETTYTDFASALCISRIRFENGGLPDGWHDHDAIGQFARIFEQALDFEKRIADKIAQINCRPWVNHLREALFLNAEYISGLGIASSSSIEEVVDLLEFGSDPLIEKTSIFLFFRAWSDGNNLRSAAVEIADSASRFYSSRDKSTLHAGRLAHFREDLRSQMLMDLRLHPLDLLQGYAGFEMWVRMSDGIIRNLIATLKRIFDWAIFLSDSLYVPGGIKLASQTRGVREASNWFIDDAKILGEDHGLVEAAVKRIARLLSALRYSEKLPESSLCTFSCEISALGELPRRILQACEMWSLLIRTADRKERNTGSHVVKFRVNGLVAPEFNLPVFSRGNIHLRTDEASVIFGLREEEQFARVLSERLARCTPPFRVQTVLSTEGSNQDELDLF